MSDCSLIYTNRQLEDDFRLFDYDIRDMNILYLILRLRTSTKTNTKRSPSVSIENIFRINIKPFIGEIYYLFVSEIISIYKIKEI